MDFKNLKKPIKAHTGEAKWKDINDLIRRWSIRNPVAFALNMDYVKDIKGGLKDKKFGQTGGAGNTGAVGSSSGTRIGLAIHPELINYIQAFYPDFLDKNEDVHEFGRRFKNFCIPEKI